ncbi:MAG: hypothetical protein GY830_01750 [Bacteroidetes bacterium]|nr:hypothetical protein [Bacteroidota bacterium]
MGYSIILLGYNLLFKTKDENLYNFSLDIILLILIAKKYLLDMLDELSPEEVLKKIEDKPYVTSPFPDIIYNEIFEYIGEIFASGTLLTDISPNDTYNSVHDKIIHDLPILFELMSSLLNGNTLDFKLDQMELIYNTNIYKKIINTISKEKKKPENLLISADSNHSDHRELLLNYSHFTGGTAFLAAMSERVFELFPGTSNILYCPPLRNL